MLTCDIVDRIDVLTAFVKLVVFVAGCHTGAAVYDSSASCQLPIEFLLLGIVFTLTICITLLAVRLLHIIIVLSSYLEENF
jgi:hypothetical protein